MDSDNDPFKSEEEDFADVIRHDLKPRVSLGDAMLNVTVVQAIIRSNEERSTVELREVLNLNKGKPMPMYQNS